MEISLFLAKVMGLYLIITSIFMLTRHKLLKDIVIELGNSRSLLFVIAMMTLILGILLVVSHNIWVMGWPVVITILSWIVFISGIIRFFLIDKAKAVVDWWLSHSKLLFGIVIVYLLLGGYLLWMGFCSGTV